MIRYLIVLLLTYAQSVQSQIKTVRGLVVNADKKAIPFAVIYSDPSKYGTICDKDGRFSVLVNVDSARSLIFYNLGYERKEIPFADLDSSVIVVLHVTNFELKDDFIVAEKKKEHSGVLGKRELAGANKSFNGIGWEEGIFLKPKHTNAFLREVFIYVTSYNTPTSDFRIHIYGNDSLPTTDITGGNIIAHADRGNEWVKVDLSDKRIPIGNGVFIGVEWISGESSPTLGLTKNYGTRAFSYNRNLAENKFLYFHGYAPMIYGTYTYSK